MAHGLLIFYGRMKIFTAFLMKKIKPDSFDLILIVIDIFINA